MRRLTLFLSALVAVLAAGYLLYPHIEFARFRHEVIGVDVSHHQGDIDWALLAGDGIAFAYIKATEGGDFVDPRFQKNWQEAKTAGLRFGAYHFYRQCKSGQEQAANFIATVPKDPDVMPPVIDAEHMGPCKPPVSFDPVAEITSFMTIVEAHFGCRPIIYTTAEFERAYLAGVLQNETFWLRSLFWPPGFRQDAWKIWQYHHKGRRDGVVGDLDLNAFRGSAADFADPRKGLSCVQKTSP